MVVGLSEIVGSKRIAINGYSRRAGDSFLKESGRIKPLVEHLLEVYSSVPYTQQVLSVHALLDGEEVPAIPGYPSIKSHCNMDPVSFHNQFVFHVLVLARRFGLTFPECIGLQTAYEVFPNTSYFFGLAACTLLRVRASRGPLPTKFRGFGFGHAMSLLMNQFYLIATQLPSGKRPGRRFSVYNRPPLQEREVWDKRCHHKMVMCLHVHHMHSIVKSRKDKAKIYKSILLSLSGQAPKVGDVIMNHSMALMAQIGLLPAWIREEAVVSPTSKYMKYFCDKFDVDKSLLLAGCEKFVLTVQAAFNSRFPNRKFTVREIENVLCKVFRLDKSTEHHWFDLFFPLQNTFSFQGDKILICSPDQNSPQETEGCLINRWPYGDTVMGVDAIVHSMNLGSIMPTDESIASFVVPRQLLFPTAKVQLDFRLNEVKRANHTAQTLSESVFDKVFI
jgi:hypothetical protein